MALLLHVDAGPKSDGVRALSRRELCLAIIDLADGMRVSDILDASLEIASIAAVRSRIPIGEALAMYSFAFENTQRANAVESPSVENAEGSAKA